jgi:hypothetical protein
MPGSSLYNHFITSKELAMSFQDVPTQYFSRAGVRPVVGFIFRYNPEDAKYGVCAVTDGSMPQMKNFEAATKVGKALQIAIFGQTADNSQTATYYKEDGHPDFANH